MTDLFDNPEAIVETEAEEQPEEQEEIEEVAEETEEAEAEEEQEEPVKAEATEEPDVTETPRAQKRIRSLISERNEAREETKYLRDLVEQMKRSNDRQETVFKKQEELLARQEAEGSSERRKQYLMSLGLDPKNPSDWFMVEQAEENQRLKKELADIKNFMDEQRSMSMVEKFNVALDRSVKEAMSKYDVPAALLDEIKELAYDRAATRGISAEEAARDVVGRLGKTLKPKASVPKVVDEAVRAVAKSGRTGGAQKGPISSQKKNFEDWLK